MPARSRQASLFEPGQIPVEGFAYQDDVISPAEEERLVTWFAGLPFREFEFGVYRGKRRIVSFGWKYDYTAQRLHKADDIPAPLLPIREHAAQFAGIAAETLQQALVTEYRPGAGIGWHKDKRQFGDVIGLSLLSPCVFRLRRRVAAGFERAAIVAEPRSAYVLRGPSRQQWEHSIPPLESLRYSITFRSFASGRTPSE